jgi:pimeloyl-ACP methyl ester carboxylesterase
MWLSSRPIELNGVRTELLEAGSGRPLLFLHSGEGPTSMSDQYLKELSEKFRVFAPWHPGFGSSRRPAHFRSVHDLAYFYLDMARSLNLRDAILVGASFGGWIAAEMAVRSTEHFSHLVLAGPFGVKVGARDERAIVDFSIMTPQEWYAAAFARVENTKRDYQAMTDEQLIGLLRSRESLLYYGWQPFMHNPQLVHWLHRVTIPTLVLRGSADKVVTVECHQAYADKIPGARMMVVPHAGHYPHIEQAEIVARSIRDFVFESAMVAA